MVALRDERLQEFGHAIDKIRADIESRIGREDVQYIKKVRRFSRTMEVTGRTLIHFSVEPVGFLSGVTALWLHKQLEATEIGHTALHGAFDKLDGAEEFRSNTFKWETPIDEPSWRQVHNIEHHQYTNIAGKDPDIAFGPIRLNDRTPHNERWHNRQVRRAVALMFNFGFGLNLQYTGVAAILDGKPEPGAWRKALRKFVPYYGRNYVFYPALAGPFFWKVLLGNFMAETMRDVYSAATIYCGHIGEDVADYPEGTKARSRAEWYKMQVEAANNFEVPLPVSMLCGALDRQIEHHLFPRWPTNRLREAAPRVREVCERHGVEYRTDTWGNTLKGVFRRLKQLSRPTERDMGYADGR
jgi:fatty acid desaturase